MHSEIGLASQQTWGNNVDKRLIRATMVTAALAALMPFSAQAADAGFCQNYAQAAINQVRGALANRRCAANIQGPRWSSDLQVHYNWCLTQPYAAAGAERDARTGFLRACRG
jgi:hypothetical protein